MWLLGLLLMGGAYAQDDADPRPEETRVGVGAIVGTGFASGPTVRLRTAGGVSVDVTVGTSITGGSDVILVGSFEFDSKPRRSALGSQVALRLPVAKVERTDVMFAAVASGRLLQLKYEQLDFGSTGTVEASIGQRAGRLGASVELDHWVSDRATVTAGLGVNLLEATRDSNTVGSASPDVSATRTVGLTTRAQAGLIVYF